MRPQLLLFFLAFLPLLLPAQQHFLKNETGHALTFKEMQIRFDEWSKTTDLKNTKGWKYFKRWESDMQRLTDAQGNLIDPAIYIDEIIKAVKEKNRNSVSRFSSSAWIPVGPNIIPNNLYGLTEKGIGRFNCIAFHPSDPATFFVGVAQGGVWKTVDNGNSWIPLTDELPITRISDIAIDPVNPDTIYISVCDYAYLGAGLLLDGRKRNTHYGLGVYKTTDGGQTWQPTGLSFQLTQGDASLIRKIIVNPNNNNQLVSCGTSGMYTSIDFGATWTQVMDSLFWDITQDPNNPNILYAATGWVMTANDGYAAIYKSTDFGQNWTMLNTGIPGTGAVQRIKLAIAPSDPNYVYAICSDVNRGLYGLYKTIDGGNNWQYIHPGVNVFDWNEGFGADGQGNYDMALLVDANNKNKLYSGGINIWGSSDGGLTFDPASHYTTQYGPSIHADIHSIDRQPGTGNIFVCHDGGLNRTSSIITQSWFDAQNGTPWPTLWTNLGNGLAATSFYRLSSSRTSTERLIAGAQDNGTFYYDNGTWSTIFGGDGMDNYLDPLDNDGVFGSSQYGNFYYSWDDGNNATSLFTNPNNELAEWTTPFIADYNNPGTLYIGNSNVMKSDDNGNFWNPISSFPWLGIADHELCALAVSPVNSDILYAGKRMRYEYSVPAAMYVTTNGGINWQDVTAGLPDSLYYTSMDADPALSQTAYVSMAGFTAGYKIFKTDNAGATWTNISYNLPNLPINCVKALPGGGLIAALDIGVYVLFPGSSAWTIMSNGLPNVIVSDIEINPALNKIYICTFGRGIWETDLNMLVGVKPVAARNDDMDLFPSVNDGAFTIRTGVNHESFSFDVIDVLGRIVYSSELKGKDNYSIVTHLPPGRYFARLRNAEYRGVKGFVVK